MASLLASSFANVALAAGQPVRASGIQLEVTRTSGAQSCPDERAVRAGVIARLGYDPFTTPIARLVMASIEGTDTGYTATVTLKSPEGRPLGHQALSYRLASCDELASAIELAIAVALDPLAVAPEPVDLKMLAAASATAPTPPTTAASRPAVAAGERQPSIPVAPVATATTEAHGDSSRLAPLLYAGVAAAFLATPTTVPALSAGVELRLGQASVALEVQGNIAGHITVPGGSIGVSQVLVALAPCYHFGFLGTCGLIEAGTQRSTATGLAPSHSASTAYFAVGARVEADVTLVSWLWLRPQVDLWIPTNRTSLQVAGVTEWRTPAASPAIGLALVVPLQ